MTHEEARELLPVYALGALDESDRPGRHDGHNQAGRADEADRADRADDADRVARAASDRPGSLPADRLVAELERHLEECERCRTELADYLETAASLGEAVETVVPPETLRAAVLASLPERPADPPRQPWWRNLPARLAPSAPESQSDYWPKSESWPLSWLTSRPMSLAGTAAVLLVFVLGLAIWSVIQQQRLQATRSELALDERGLALLTSTETTVVRLDPVAGGNTPAHGHWYHRAGIDTLVLVVEFMPPVTSGEAYYGWLQRADGTWEPTGQFTLNGDGYGRLILLGGDGADVRSVAITRQTQPSAAPTGEVVLHWSAQTP